MFNINKDWALQLHAARRDARRAALFEALTSNNLFPLIRYVKARIPHSMRHCKDLHERNAQMFNRLLKLRNQYGKRTV